MSGTNLYAGGNFTTAGGVPANYIAKWNGSAWSALGLGDGRALRCLCAGGERDQSLRWGRLHHGGRGAGQLHRQMGRQRLVGLGLGDERRLVYALAVSGTDLYAGGYFTTAGGVPANYIAKWNGSAWSALGSGMNGDGLCAGGERDQSLRWGMFTTAGGVPANYIAKWDGSAWSALGSGMGGSGPYVYALAADGAGHLFVGGSFYLAGTNVSPYIAQANVGIVPTSGPPVIVASPASLVVRIGATADFQVEAAGSPPLVYQWVFNGTTAIAGATGSVLSLTNVQPGASGSLQRDRQQ